MPNGFAHKKISEKCQNRRRGVQNYDMKISHPIKVIVVVFVRVIVFVVFVLAVVIVTTLTQPQLKQYNHKLNVINISTVPDPI